MFGKFGKKLNDIFEVSFSTKETQIKDSRYMGKVNEFIKFINEKLEKIEADRMEKNRQTLKLKNGLKT